MKTYKKILQFSIPLFAIIAVSGCTKLNEKLNSTLTNPQVSSSLGSAGTGLLLSAAYSDLATPVGGQDNALFSLNENTTDEALIPTRGGDWDDNGVWRVLHAHNWNADHAYVLSNFNALNKINFDATNVLGFNPTPAQAAEARFLRAFALFNLLDLYGQYPIRNPGDNLLLAPEVKSGAAAIDFIITELTTILPDIPAANGPDKANPDAVRTLLMKCYLQKGAFINRAAPTFDPGDMAQVVTLGNAIIANPKYAYTPDYFANFTPNNHGSKEAIFLYPNTGGVGTNHSPTEARWNMTLHYNSYTPNNPNAGWNGFTTISDFYNSFNITGTPTAFGPTDTLFDPRIGGRYYPGSSDKSGIRPGFLVGQQHNENGAIIHDRIWKPTDPVNTHLLFYEKDIAANMIELGSNLEVTGIRVIKYVPDYDHYGGPANNDLMIYRYPDVVLMVAEAKLRINAADATALTMVNALRTARGAAPLPSMTLANPANVEDPLTLIAERGRELYWENVRRQDLIRFGLYLKPWQYKPSDDPKNLVFPIPSQALAANPNLTQNTGY
jgi:starch-binding outer membrane protein, SusD/RagB family